MAPEVRSSETDGTCCSNNDSKRPYQHAQPIAPAKKGCVVPGEEGNSNLNGRLCGRYLFCGTFDTAAGGMKAKADTETELPFWVVCRKENETSSALYIVINLSKGEHIIEWHPSKGPSLLDKKIFTLKKRYELNKEDDIIARMMEDWMTAYGEGVDAGERIAEYRALCEQRRFTRQLQQNA